MIGCSGFGDSFGRVEDAASDNIQGIIFLGGGLIWNNNAVCGGRMEFKIFVRDKYETFKSLERNPYMIFSVTLICWQ